MAEMSQNPKDPLTISRITNRLITFDESQNFDLKRHTMDDLVERVDALSVKPRTKRVTRRNWS